MKYCIIHECHGGDLNYGYLSLELLPERFDTVKDAYAGCIRARDEYIKTVREDLQRIARTYASCMEWASVEWGLHGGSEIFYICKVKND